MAVKKNPVPVSKMSKHEKRMKNIRAKEIAIYERKLSRPMSSLDRKAVDLGIYSDAFHVSSREERKRTVSCELSKRKAQAA